VDASRATRSASVPPVFVVGLTGGIGSGKTTVAHLLAAHGAQIIDCDALGRLVAEPAGRAYPSIVERFGPGVIGPDGRIDRPALAGIVFNDPAALADLNAITHPAIDAEIADRLEKLPSDSIVVLDMAVLTESTLGRGLYEFVVVVEAVPATRILRLIDRGLTEADAQARMASQATDAQRRAIADDVVENRGDLRDLEHAVTALWDTLQGRAARASSRLDR
jgi:dephospho-CoA kinase